MSSRYRVTSEDRAASAGIVPDRELSFRSRYVSDVRAASSGIVPVKSLFIRYRTVSEVRAASAAGSVPRRALSCRSKRSSEVRAARSSESFPFSPLAGRIILMTLPSSLHVIPNQPQWSSASVSHPSVLIHFFFPFVEAKRLISVCRSSSIFRNISKILGKSPID